MALPTNIVKKFATIVNEDNTEKTNDTYFGTTVVDSNGTYVKLDGSTELTPVSLATDAKANDRVIVSITDHKARVTINLTNPASGYSASDLYDGVTKTGILAASKIFADKLDVKGRVTAESIDVNSIFATDIIATGSIEGATLKGSTSIESGGTIKGGTISADHVHSSELIDGYAYQFIDVSSGEIIVGISDTDILGSANEIREIKINHDGIYFRDSACLTSEGLGYRKTDYSVPPVLEVNSDGEGVYMKSTATYNRTSTGAANLYMTANGVFRRSTASSRRWKNSIAPAEGALDPDKLYDAKVRQFKFNTDYLSNKKDECYDVPVIGFIAEELNEVYPIAVTHGTDDNGSPTCEDWNVRYMVPAMLQLIQEQNERLKKLEASNA